jgi:hypothetical protein
MKRAVILIGLFAILLAAAEVSGHIPTVSFLLNKLASQRTKMGVRRLKVSMQCKRGDQEQIGHVLYLKVPGLVRRERGGQSVEVCSGGKCWIKHGTSQPKRLPKWAYLPYLYFVEYDVKGSRYQSLLESLKVDVNVDTITRFHSRLAVVLGAKSWERDRPQFWLDKDRFLPLRLMLLDGKSLVDIMWIKWGTKVGGDWFPATLEVRRDGKVLERCEVTEVESGVSMPKKLFKLQ